MTARLNRLVQPCRTQKAGCQHGRRLRGLYRLVKRLIRRAIKPPSAWGQIMSARQSIAFSRIAGAALPYADTIVRRWLPDGRREGAEWVCRNPKRSDHRAGSFKVNLMTGKWGDFATGDAGGDIVSLGAYLFGLSQKESALKVAEMLAINPYE